MIYEHDQKYPLPIKLTLVQKSATPIGEPIDLRVPGAEKVQLWTATPSTHENNYLVQQDRWDLRPDISILVSYGSSEGVRGAKPNEDYDSAVNFGPIGLFLVLDGMGGHKGWGATGRNASEIGLRTIVSEFLEGSKKVTRWDSNTSLTLLEEAIQKGHRAIWQKDADIGTTISGFALDGDIASIVNIGDSRTYYYDATKNELDRITKDHSWVEQKVELNKIKREDVYSDPERNIIYRSLGGKEPVKIDTFQETVAIGDIMLVCCDGLWELVRPGRIAALCKEFGDKNDMQGLVLALIQEACANGGPDDTSVMAIKRIAPFTPEMQAISERPTTILASKAEAAEINETDPRIGRVVCALFEEGPYGPYINSTDWVLQDLWTPEGSEEETVTLTLIDNPVVTENLPYAIFDKLNPTRIEDIDPTSLDPLSGFRNALQYLPNQEIQGEDGTTYTLSMLNRLIDAVIENPTIISKIRLKDGGIFIRKLNDIMWAIRKLKVGDTVLIPRIDPGAKHNASEYAIIKSIDKTPTDFAKVDTFSGITNVPVSIQALRERNPRTMPELKRSTPDTVRAFESLLTHYFGGRIQSSGNESYSSDQLISFLIAFLQKKVSVSDAPRGAGYRNKLEELFISQ